MLNQACRIHMNRDNGARIASGNLVALAVELAICRRVAVQSELLTGHGAFESTEYAAFSVIASQE